MEDMLRACALDFQGSWEDNLPLIEFSYNNSYHTSIKMAPFKALYGRKCRSPVCWNDCSERVTLGTDFIEDMVSKVRLIQSRIKAAQDRQNSYADLKRRDDEFNVGDKLALPIEFEKMHDVFHISQLKKYVPSETHVLQPETIQVDESLTYEERPVKILDHKVQSTRNKDVKIVKVLWSNHEYEEATWEAEEEMRKKYPE
ncbi:uncharacterized protein LOC110694331 [Chenopodium quinoa]|uniref:uncharacterized protein LOC110694331 n=1 Tax=Chenopodium quinoa TaxID=63459 RepID=UPI000B77C2E0|nr:uncharacterized protein LOC110694331 [Chenopodium quinoa]